VIVDERLAARLYDAAHADRWRLTRAAFTQALEASAARALSTRAMDRNATTAYLEALHLEDLALACACAAGDDAAWQHFVLTHRPVLYRAADAIDPGGGRELADSLYADLFGLGTTGGERRSLFRYFHGRSSLATWLRAVLAQRHVDQLRTFKRHEPLPDDDSPAALSGEVKLPDPERSRFVVLMREALACALALLAPKDRWRLACYYAQQMTLAQIGRLTGEHEATVSRQLTRTRAAMRASIEEYLVREHHLDSEAVTECFRSLGDDAGPLDLTELLSGSALGIDMPAGKKRSLDRSRKEGGV
jgi:RNA polymerase sigma-70 factor (ECF subfamily)